jgi:hypothetical protein
MQRGVGGTDFNAASQEPIQREGAKNGNGKAPRKDSAVVRGPPMPGQ